MGKNTINLAIVIQLIKKNIKFILSIVLISTFICSVYIFVSDQYYESYISVYKTSNDNTMKNFQGLSGINNLAQNLGININNSNSLF